MEDGGLYRRRKKNLKKEEEKLDAAKMEYSETQIFYPEEKVDDPNDKKM